MLQVLDGPSPWLKHGGAQSFASVLQNTPFATCLAYARQWRDGTRLDETKFMSLGRDDVALRDRSDHTPVVEIFGFLNLHREPLLPSDRAQLFEMLVLTRAARALTGLSGSIRWIDLEASNNTVHAGDVHLRVQRHLGRERVLQSGVYDAALVGALQTFQVRVPSIADIVIELPNVNSQVLSGIIIEVKSGGSEYGHAVGQLAAYRAAIPRAPGQRLLVWGVTENGPLLTQEQCAWLRSQTARGEGDVWAFSSAGDIAKVLEATVGSRVTIA